MGGVREEERKLGENAKENQHTFCRDIRMIPETAVICAAGRGTRLGFNMPKCLVEIAGRPIVDYQLVQLSDIPDVRMVVGFQAQRVVEHVKKIRPNVTFIHNKVFAKTTVLQSLYLGIQGVKNPFLTVHGDIIPERDSFARFLKACAKGAPLGALCPAGTTDAIYANVEKDEKSDFIITSFQRKPVTPWEWPAICYILPEMIEDNPTLLCQQIEKYLPMPALPLMCWEIDTPEDLQRAMREIQHVVA